MQSSKDQRIGCLLMAAGNASRFKTNKLLVEFGGKPLVRWAMETIGRSGFDRVVVVTQYPEVSHMAAEFGYDCIRNAHPDWGAAYTICLGTEALGNCDAIMYMVADQPLLDDDSVARILRVWRENPNQIVSPIHKGKTGNPCIFPKEFFPELMALEGDVGGKAVIRQHTDRLLTVEVSGKELFDCDTPEALAQLKQQTEK